MESSKLERVGRVSSSLFLLGRTLFWSYSLESFTLWVPYARVNHHSESPATARDIGQWEADLPSRPRAPSSILSSKWLKWKSLSRVIEKQGTSFRVANPEKGRTGRLAS